MWRHVERSGNTAGPCQGSLFNLTPSGGGVCETLGQLVAQWCIWTETTSRFESGPSLGILKRRKTMIVYYRWRVERGECGKDGYRCHYCEGWFLFGLIPLYLRIDGVGSA